MVAVVFGFQTAMLLGSACYLLAAGSSLLMTQ
jgi:hypothetical protein